MKEDKSYGAKFVECGVCFSSGIQYWPKIALLKILWRKMHYDDPYLVADLLCRVLFFLSFSPKSGAVNIMCLKRRSTWVWFWLLVLVAPVIRDFSSGNIHDMLCYRKMFPKCCAVVTARRVAKNSMQEYSYSSVEDARSLKNVTQMAVYKTFVATSAVCPGSTIDWA